MCYLSGVPVVCESCMGKGSLVAKVTYGTLTYSDQSSNACMVFITNSTRKREGTDQQSLATIIMHPQVRAHHSVNCCRHIMFLKLLFCAAIAACSAQNDPAPQGNPAPATVPVQAVRGTAEGTFPNEEQLAEARRLLTAQIESWPH